MDDDEKRLLSRYDDSDSSEVSYEDQKFQRTRQTSSFRVGIILTVLNSIVLAISVTFFYLGLSKNACPEVTDQEHYTSTSAYSPILSRFTIPKITTTINGTLYPTTPLPPLRDPGPAGDAEWFRIGSGVFPLVLNSSEIRLLGKDPSTSVRLPSTAGYGSDAFIAQTDVFHHLHCIDMLRRDIYHPWDSRAEKDKPSSDRQHWAHIGHCLDILAHATKCAASVDMITFNWVEGWDQPFPDFATKKVCRDFEGLWEWVSEHEIPHEVFQGLKSPPEGYVRLPEPGSEVMSEKED